MFPTRYRSRQQHLLPDTQSAQPFPSVLWVRLFLSFPLGLWVRESWKQPLLGRWGQLHLWTPRNRLALSAQRLSMLRLSAQWGRGSSRQRRLGRWGQSPPGRPSGQLARQPWSLRLSGRSGLLRPYRPLGRSDRYFRLRRSIRWGQLGRYSPWVRLARQPTRQRQ